MARYKIPSLTFNSTCIYILNINTLLLPFIEVVEQDNSKFIVSH